MHYNEYLLHNPFLMQYLMLVFGAGLNKESGIWETFPININTASVSPIALVKPRINAIIIPGRAVGMIIFLIHCHFVYIHLEPLLLNLAL